MLIALIANYCKSNENFANSTGRKKRDSSNETKNFVRFSNLGEMNGAGFAIIHFIKFK